LSIIGSAPWSDESRYLDQFFIEKAKQGDGQAGIERRMQRQR